jgi:hypothetical protein
MEAYILILTLAMSGDNGKSYAGLGGISMGEFSSKSSCEAAKKLWLKEIGKSKPLQVPFAGGPSNNIKLAICTPK